MRICVLIPSFNTGKELLRETVASALRAWDDVIVVIDGSTDGSDNDLESIVEAQGKSFHVFRLQQNVGKGAAVLEGIQAAEKEGFTHVLCMDADGQHPAEFIEKFMQMGQQHPEALILGEPQFDDSAPAIRVGGRKISNWWANLETLWWGIHDSLFGMRLYPIEPLKKVFVSTLGARRFDFEPEVAVRLCWQGLPVINIKTPVRYLSEEEGGVSQFRYLRDNVLLIGMHARLFVGFLMRVPILLVRRIKRGPNPLRNKNC